ncbi:MAG: ECF transporter S component [Christensenellaceae bacterium]|jgi:uncharacterized membrane protein
MEENRMSIRKEKTNKLTMMAVFTALVFVVTFLVRIPVPGTGGAYLNFGDVVIYIAAFTIGGPYAAVAAALGSMLTDVVAGAAVYALPTLIIKGAMALVFGMIVKKRSFARYALASAVCGGVMACGYGLYEYAMFGAEYMLAALPFNLIQWAGAAAAACAFYPAARRIQKYARSKGGS